MSTSELAARLAGTEAWQRARVWAESYDWAAIARTALMVVVAAFLVSKAWDYGDWVATKGSVGKIILSLLLMVVASVILVFLGSWRAGVYPFLFWLVFEDLPRKFLGNNMLIYLGKDVLAATLYLAFFGAVLRGKVKLFRPPFLIPLLLFFWLALIQAFNPNTPSLLYSVLGLRLYFFYVPLMFVGYALIRTEGDLHRFLSFNLAIAGVVAALGITQAIVGMDFLNPKELAVEIAGLSALSRMTASGESFARPSAIFVSDGRFAWYLLLMFLLGLGGLGYKLLRRDARWKTILSGFGLCAVGLLLSGSRGAVAYTAFSAACVLGIFFVAEPPHSRGRLWLARTLKRATILAGVAIGVFTALFPQKVLVPLSYYYDTMTPWGENSELYYRVVQYPFVSLFKAGDFENWFLGNGLGTAGLGRQYIEAIFGKQSFHGWVESGWGALILEMGVWAPLFWVGWTCALVYYGARVVRSLLGTPLFPLGLAILWFVFILLVPLSFFGIQPYQNYIYNAFLWLLVGMLFKLPVLARAAGYELAPVPSRRHPEHAQ